MGFQVVRSVQTQRWPMVSSFFPGMLASRRVQGALGPATRSSVTFSKASVAAKLLMMVATQMRTDSSMPMAVARR